MNRSTSKKLDKKNSGRNQDGQADNNTGDTNTQAKRPLTRQYSDLSVVDGIDNRLVVTIESTPILLNNHFQRHEGPGSPYNQERQYRWKCGYSSESWAKLFAVCDVVKGTFGLIFAAYLAISIFRLMAKTPDFQDLKRRMGRTEFVYLFAYGATSLGISLSVCGMALYHFLLIVFGKILFDAVTQRSTPKLRLWYIYAFLSTIIFIFLYCRLIFASLECSELQLCQAEHNSIVWIIAICYYLLSFVPSIYSIAITKSLVNEICRQRRQERRALALSQSRSQSQSQFQTAAQNSSSTNNIFTPTTPNNYNTYDNYTTSTINYETKLNYNPALHPRGFNL